MASQQASVWDSMLAVADVVAPTIGKGVIVRRPKVVRMAERLGLDDRAVKRMQKLRATYGEKPLAIRSPGKSRFLILAAEDVTTVLERTPEPFATRTDEKHAALAHFEPKVALISHGSERAQRRRFNETVLRTEMRNHPLKETFRKVVNREMDGVAERALSSGKLDWDSFTQAWHRMVREVVLGTNARDDEELTKMLEQLRSRANWAFFQSRDRTLRSRFHERLAAHLQRGEPGSLAQVIFALPKDEATAPSHQVSQWLFAFDPGGMATYRALGLLAAHPEGMRRARHEVEADGDDPQSPMPFLRASLLEALRLWPTTPAILRQTTRSVELNDVELPEDSTVMIFAPYFHRDDQRIEFAHSFSPDIWLTGDSKQWPLVPFSGGPAICPARNFVPMIASMAMARILSRLGKVEIADGRLGNTERLPGTLDNYTLEFKVEAPVRQPLPA